MSDRAIIKDVDMSEEMAEVRSAHFLQRPSRTLINFPRSCVLPKRDVVILYSYSLFRYSLHYVLPRCHGKHQDMFRIAQEAIDKFSVLQEAASTIKKTCDQKFSPTWCVDVELVHLM